MALQGQKIDQVLAKLDYANTEQVNLFLRLDTRMTNIARAIGDFERQTQLGQGQHTYFNDGLSELRFGWTCHVTTTPGGARLVEVDVDRDAVLIHYLRHAEEAKVHSHRTEWQMRTDTRSAWAHFVRAREPNKELIVELQPGGSRRTGMGKRLLLGFI